MTNPSAETNPLVQAWDTPYGLVPFERVRAEHFEPALTQAMRDHIAELDAIAADPEPADFDNTLAAFDRAGNLFWRVLAVFDNLCASETSPELQAVQRKMAMPLAAHESATYMHGA